MANPPGTGLPDDGGVLADYPVTVAPGQAPFIQPRPNGPVYPMWVSALAGDPPVAPPLPQFANVAIPKELLYALVWIPYVGWRYVKVDMTNS